MSVICKCTPVEYRVCRNESIRTLVVIVLEDILGLNGNYERRHKEISMRKSDKNDDLPEIMKEFYKRTYKILLIGVQLEV